MTTKNTHNLLHNRTILLIDDEPILIRMYTKRLGMLGAKIIAASNGLEGLKALEEHNIDLVLLDLGMPGMDGRETLKKMRKNPITKNIPVIVFSNTTVNHHRHKEGYEDIKQAGVKDILRKYETSFDELIDRINNYFTEGSI